MTGLFDRFPLARRTRELAAERDAAEQALAEKDAALAALFETGTAGIAEVDFRSGRFARVNRRLCEILRRDAEDLLKLTPGHIIHPEDSEGVRAEWTRAMRASGRWEGEVRHVWPDGGEFWLRIGVSAWKRDDKGRPLRSIAVVQDITESVRAKERLRDNEAMLRLAQAVGRIGAFERDLRTDEVFVSAEARVMFGLARRDRKVRPGDWVNSFVPEDRPRLLLAIREALQRRDEELAIECRIQRPSGALGHLEMRARYFYDDVGRPRRSVGVVIDVTERKEAEQRLAHAARHDALTGLPNRLLLRERLEAASARAAAGEPFAVLCLDLDRFKDVNDTLGHPFGDRLLVEVGKRLQQELSSGDTLARLGGDEFAVLQADPASREESGRLARRLVERIGEPFVIDEQRVVIGASVGVATAPRDGRLGAELLSSADLALYQAKAQRTRGWRFYEPRMNEEAQARRELERDLQRGLANEEFELFYQPVLEVSTLRVQCFEALIRWRQPQGGLAAPAHFIPLCEEMGLINKLGAWVLRRACRDAAGWPEPIGVAVNVSAVQVGAGDLDAVVAAALAESGLAAGRLELEITETALLGDSDVTLATLRRLKALGVRIAMDDFGAGHSSLGFLQRFPFDKIKIDRAFACEVDRSARSAAIVKAMLDLCAALGMATTIEGVETEAQFQALARMGGQSVQGFLFSPPRPIGFAAAMLQQFGGVAALTQAAE